MRSIRALRSIPYPWVVLGLCILSVMAVANIEWSLGVLFPFIQEDLDVTRAELGLITAGMLIGGAPAVVLAGWLVDRLGVRLVQSVALVGVTAGVLAFSQIDSLLQGVLLATFMGIGITVTAPSYVKAIVSWVPVRRRGSGLGITEAGVPIAGIIATVVLSLLAETVGWRWAVGVLAIMTGTSCVVFFALYRDRPSDETQPETRAPGEGRVVLVLKNRAIWLAALGGAALSTLHFILISFLVLFLKEDMGASSLVAGAVLALAMAGGAVGRLTWGLVADFLLRGSRVHILVMLGVLSAIASALFGSIPTTTPMVLIGLLAVFAGATMLGWTGLFSLVLSDLAGPDLIGTTVGFAIMMLRLGSFGAAPLFGLIVDQTAESSIGVNSYSFAWWGVAAFGVVGAVLLAFVRPQARRA